jgi:hypothetical protein
MSQRHPIAAKSAIWLIWEDHQMAKCGSHATGDAFLTQILQNFMSVFHLPICLFSTIIPNMTACSQPALSNWFLQPSLFHILDKLHSAMPVGFRWQCVSTPPWLSIRLTWPFTHNLQNIFSEFIYTLMCPASHTTHALQPCDVGAFGPLAQSWKYKATLASQSLIAIRKDNLLAHYHTVCIEAPKTTTV